MPQIGANPPPFLCRFAEVKAPSVESTLPVAASTAPGIETRREKVAVDEERDDYNDVLPAPLIRTQKQPAVAPPEILPLLVAEPPTRPQPVNEDALVRGYEEDEAASNGGASVNTINMSSATAGSGASGTAGGGSGESDSVRVAEEGVPAAAAGGSGGDSEGDDDVFLEAAPAKLASMETGEGHSAADLQHISDREDHAQHEIAVKGSLIINSASAPSSPTTPVRRPSALSPQRRMSHVPGENTENGLRRSNSTSTLFVDSTVSRPNMEDTLRCVALALHYTIVDGHAQEEPETYPSKFDERTFPLTEARVPHTYATDIPDDEIIYDFMNRLFHAAALTAECGIITIVYINRVIQYTGLALHASNWKRVLLGAILMASKVWDDQAVWNVDFCSILPKIEVEDMNDLERTYLEMLQFNINVDSSVYAMYYFELRSLADEAQRPFPLEPMTMSQAAKLEATAKHVAEAAVKEGSMRGSKSMDHKDFPTRAVLP